MIFGTFAHLEGVMLAQHDPGVLGPRGDRNSLVIPNIHDRRRALCLQNTKQLVHCVIKYCN
jgi:hypothetical protein